MSILKEQYDGFLYMNIDKTKYESLFQKAKKRDVKSMCKKVNEISGLNPIDLLKKAKQENACPVDLTAIFKAIGVSAIPTDLSVIETSPSMKKQVEERGRILGALIKNGDNLAVFYSNDKELMSEHRIRFTLAHELGHCCMHGDEDHIEFRQDSALEDEKESVANIFAGELLIPEHTLKNIYEKLWLPTVVALADLFETSAAVMEARLRYLNMKIIKI